MTKTIRAAMAVLFLCLPVCTLLAQPIYQPSLLSAGAWGQAVNPNGNAAAGRVGNLPAVWRGGVLSLIPVEAVNGVAVAVAPNQTAAGYFRRPDFAVRGFQDKAGVVTIFDPAPGFANAAIYGVNNACVKVGASWNGTASVPTIWRGKTAIGEEIAAPGLAGGDAAGINERQEVALNTLSVDGLWLAQLYHSTDRYGLPLYPAGGRVHSRANAINSEGVVAGFSAGPGPPVATVWYQGSVYEFGGGQSVILGLNDVGEFVGWYGGANEPRAALWIAGFLYDLNGLIPPDSGWLLECATGIDNEGGVVGWGRLNGVRAAFSLTKL